jgi:polysaccharide export outer membrane protein
MRRAYALLLACALAVTPSCLTTTVRFVRPAPPAEDNALGPNDIFAIRVFGETDLSQDYRVAADGTIDYPYIGRVRIQGLDPPQVADLIRAQLIEHNVLRSPNVSVFTREINSRHVLILGQVQRPGTLPFEQNMTILQAITNAGGFTPLADQRSVRLTRRITSGERRSYVIPVDLIAEGRVGNVQIAPNDIISIPQVAF